MSTTSASTSASDRPVRSGCDHEWFATSNSGSLTMSSTTGQVSGSDRRSPSTKNVAGTPFRRRVSTIRGVTSASGPSSNDNATRPPSGAGSAPVMPEQSHRRSSTSGDTVPVPTLPPCPLPEPTVVDAVSPLVPTTGNKHATSDPISTPHPRR